MNGIRQNEGRKVVLEGIYQQHDIRSERMRTYPPKYYGDVMIVLKDGTNVILNPIWHKDKIRSDSEIRMFENKCVHVEGRVFETAPDSGKGLANMLAPCITDITKITAIT